ncbi:MAG TPA: CARDB domain-containing protein [Candidatus Dormibacteraeota bacterium]|nr:CARDB domain-containing protein [Candidatus Dormibacteraeota bacterium]
MTRMKLPALTLAAALSLSLVGGASAGARAGHAPPRPDLVVSSGSVLAQGGRLEGSFTVRNAGSARAGRSWATLAIRVSGRARTVGRFHVGALRRSASQLITVSLRLPSGLPTGSFPLQACANSDGAVRERSGTNNCRRVGTVQVVRSGGGGPPASSVPPKPIPFQKDTVFTLNSSQSTYWTYVPGSYDDTHHTPTELFVWLHGCGGEAAGDIYTISPGGSAQQYISVAVGGREDACWDPNTDQEKVFAAIADVESHFNIDPHRVVIGGYSSGGDLAYRTAFYHANAFAGLLAENTSPFRDTGSTQQASLAAAAWKFNVVHLAHTEDEVYPIDGVRQETDAMAAAGFPMQRIERPGHHYDDSTADSGTDHDLQTLLLPHLNDGWRSP